MKLLEQEGRNFIGKGEQLKYLLAPVLARNAAEQARFYEIFDLYWAEMSTLPDRAEGPAEKKSYLGWILLLLALAAAIIWGLKHCGDGGELPAPVPQIETDSLPPEGETVPIEVPEETAPPPETLSTDTLPMQRYFLLEEDPLDKAVRVHTWVWLLFVVLMISTSFFWSRWNRRPYPVPPTPPTPAERFPPPPDQAPYYIPFEAQEQNIHVAPELYRLADLLRARQEGLRKEFDIDDTLHATIESGGYPSWRERARSQAAEYLFLYDAQNDRDQQGRLFAYLLQFLKERDVYAELYAYDGSFERFYNREHPEGLSLELLQRLYPGHRLVVLGHGHGLIDPFAKGRPALLEEPLAELQRWKHRLLLSTLPVSSWTYRERLLKEQFLLFPAEQEALLKAIPLLDERQDDEEAALPGYDRWQELLAAKFPAPNVNYVDWDSLDDCRDYLAEHPGVFLWLCGLAVYPEPDWAMTLAIGHALEPEGVQVSYDNLLLLTRIGWLRSGNMDEDLRTELLAELQPAQERLAREAVQRELEAVRERVAGSHASMDWQVNHAVQTFALNPSDPDARETLRQLLAAGWIPLPQEEELQKSLDKHQQRTAAMQKGGGYMTYSLSQWLETDEEPEQTEAEPLPRPFFTPDFYRAVGFTLWALLVLWLALTPGVARQVPGNLAAEQVLPDSARWYNNAAVAIAQRLPAMDSVHLNDSLPLGLDYLRRASNLRVEQYRLALKNSHRYVHNAAALYLNRYLEASLPLDTLRSKYMFAQAAAKGPLDSLVLHSVHLEGLYHYYLDEIPRATQLRDTLDGLGYFEEKPKPHLKSLLGIQADEPSEIPEQNQAPAQPGEQTTIVQDSNTSPGNRQPGSEGTDPEQQPPPKKKLHTNWQPGSEGTDTEQQRPPRALPQHIQRIRNNMVRVEGGTFTMGCLEGRDTDCYDSEKPPHEVQLTDFAIGRYEVTNEEYAAFLNAKGNQEEGGVTWIEIGGTGWGGERCRIREVKPSMFAVEQGYEQHPVIYVSWYGARAFAAWMKEETGQNFRLPTEAEWEYAARGGQKGKANNFLYSGSNNIDDVAWYDENTNDNGTRQVGVKKANELGLYDMSGNVAEWCGDWYSEDYYSECAKQGLVVNPKGPEGGSHRVLRGGSWFDVVRFCRSGDRYYRQQYYGHYDFGFRLVLVP